MINFPPAFYVGTWIFFSASVILYNKWIFTSAGFSYPLFLTFIHLLFATISTRLLKRFTNLLNGVEKVEMNWKEYFVNIGSIGVFFSLSLAFCNFAYLSLSVSFIQMLKALTPALVLLFSALLVGDLPSKGKIINVSIVVLGVILTAYGEIDFTFYGFLFQALGIIAESLRLVLVQKLMTSKGLNLDPLCSLYYLAPICTVLNGLAFLLIELRYFKIQYLLDLGFPVLLSNAAVAFCLNISVMFLIGKTSSLVLTLCGTLKDLILIFLSILIFGSEITKIQCIGYSIALLGLIAYKNGGELPGKDEFWSYFSSPKRSALTSVGFFLCTLLCIGIIAHQNNHSLDYISEEYKLPPFMGQGNVEFLDRYDPPISTRYLKPILFFISAGSSAQSNLNGTIELIGFKRASYIIQIYDDSFEEWKKYSWFHNVTFIHAPHQTKIWGMSRFLTESTASSYEYIFAWDDDVVIDASFDVDAYLEILRRYNIHVSQPALESNYHYPVSKKVKYSVIGHWVTFVEIMAPVFKSETWLSCGSRMFQPNVRLGWGIDTYMFRLCKDTKFCRMAVIDAFTVTHLDKKTMKASNETDGVWKEGMEEVEAQRNHLGKWCRMAGMKSSLCKNWGISIPKEIDYLKIIHDGDVGGTKCFNFGTGYVDARDLIQEE